jgi:hypothetical protein
LQVIIDETERQHHQRELQIYQTSRWDLSPHNDICAHVSCAPPRARRVFLILDPLAILLCNMRYLHKTAFVDNDDAAPRCTFEIHQHRTMCPSLRRH